jgi:transcriptional regulator with XRE-family HTH domain
MHIVHIGSKIKETAEARGISKAELARRLNMSSTNVHKIFKRESVDTQLLSNISKALEHNFFQYFMDEYHSDEITDYNEKLTVYKKLIDLLEEKVKPLEARV